MNLHTILKPSLLDNALWSKKPNICLKLHYGWKYGVSDQPVGLFLRQKMMLNVQGGRYTIFLDLSILRCTCLLKYYTTAYKYVNQNQKSVFNAYLNAPVVFILLTLANFWKKIIYSQYLQAKNYIPFICSIKSLILKLKGSIPCFFYFESWLL